MNDSIFSLKAFCVVVFVLVSLTEVESRSDPEAFGQKSVRSPV